MEKNKEFPKVSITYNETLDPIFVFYSQHSEIGKKLKWDSWTPPSNDEMKKRIRQYRETWKPFEESFFKMMEEVTNTPCINKVIDVHIVSGSPRQIGFPIIIKSGFSNEEFITIIIHELIHYYINIHQLPKSFENEKLINETALTKKHIIVFSIMKYFFDDIIQKPQFTIAAIEKSKKHSTIEYTQAWNEVEKDYLGIIETFKKQV